MKELARKASDGVRLEIQLLKVKSHIGIEGNEKADKLAHEACRPRECSDSAREGVEIMEDMYWPHFLGRKIHNAAGGAAIVVMNGQRKDQTSQADLARQDGLGKFPKKKKKIKELLAGPGVVKAKSHSEWPSRGLSCRTPLGKFRVNDLRKGPKTLLKPGCSMGFLKQDYLRTSMGGSNGLHSTVQTKQCFSGPIFLNLTGMIIAIIPPQYFVELGKCHMV